MTLEKSDHAAFRRPVYALLITVAVAAVCARILSTIRVYEPNLSRPDGAQDEIRPVWPKIRPNPMPTFSSNDRSRWATVRALVDEGAFVIGHRDPALKSAENPYGDTGIVFEDGWQTIDRVLNPETQQFYSSKPPLLPTLVAGEYWVLQKLFGWTLRDHPFQVVRVVLLTFNAIPLLCYLIVLARLLERYATSNWGRFFVLVAACFGTMVTSFAITLNNHSLAACCVVFALASALRIWTWPEPLNGQNDRPPVTLFLLSGFFAGLTACTELPAAAFAVLLLGILLLKAPRRTLAFFVPAALLPVAAFFLTNYLALGRLTPAYGEFGGPWYEYPGSHWERKPDKEPRGIDWAGLKETKGTYAFHLLLGHHGLFSLEPIFLLSVAGIAVALFAAGGLRDRRVWQGLLPARAPPGPRAVSVLVAAVTLLLSVVVIAFYITRTTNYGGWSSGPRWLMWLTPLLLLAMLPAVDGLSSRRWGRGLAYVLLAFAVFSSNYYNWNPWRQPWIYNLMEEHGWIRY